MRRQLKSVDVGLDLGLDRRDSEGHLAHIATALALLRAQRVQALLGHAQRREQGPAGAQHGLLEHRGQLVGHGRHGNCRAEASAKALTHQVFGARGVGRANRRQAGVGQACDAHTRFGKALVATGAEFGHAGERRHQHGNRGQHRRPLPQRRHAAGPPTAVGAVRARIGAELHAGEPRRGDAQYESWDQEPRTGAGKAPRRSPPGRATRPDRERRQGRPGLCAALPKFTGPRAPVTALPALTFFGGVRVNPANASRSHRGSHVVFSAQPPAQRHSRQSDMVPRLPTAPPPSAGRLAKTQ